MQQTEILKEVQQRKKATIIQKDTTASVTSHNAVQLMKEDQQKKRNIRYKDKKENYELRNGIIFANMMMPGKEKN